MPARLGCRRRRAHSARRGLIPFLDGAAVLPCLLEVEQARPLERGYVMVEPRRRLSQEIGDLFGGARPLREKLEEAQAQRMRERPHLGDAWVERRRAGS